MPAHLTRCQNKALLITYNAHNLTRWPSFSRNSLPSEFQSPHGADPNTVQFGGVCKSEQGKDIACKKVRVRTQTDCTTSKEAISQVKAFSKLSSPTQGYLWVPVMHFSKNILFLPHLSPSTDKPPALQDETEVLQGALKCLKCQITGLLSQIMSEIL